MGIFAVLISAAIIFFKNINVYPLRNWDEAWYAEIIKNMASGNYHLLMPFWNGRYYFDHSPLNFWLTTIVVKLFGIGEWQLRFVSAAAALIATYLIFLIGKELKDKKLGLICAFVFLTLGQVITRFSQGNLDALLICLFSASFYFYLKSENQKVFAIFCGISLGLGVLVKSWGIGLYPFALIFAYSILKNKFLPKNIFLILVTSFAMFAWWYIWGIITFGKQFVSWYILNPSENRLETPIANFSVFYFKVFLRDVGFWFIPVLITIFLRNWKEKFQPTAVVASFLLVSTIYITSLNFLSDKSDWYNLVAYPLIAIAIAYPTYHLIGKNHKLSSIFVLIIILSQIWNIQRIENIYPDRSKVGADLGVFAKDKIPKNSTVVLDDHDFTSFLYYSDQIAVYTIENNRKSQTSEWWKIKHEELEGFINSHSDVWLITPNPQNLGLGTIQYKQVDSFNNYYFLKF